MNVEGVLHVLGRIALLLGVALFVPLALALVEGGPGAPLSQALLVSATVALGFGAALRLAFETPVSGFGAGEACAALAGGFLACTALGALPFVISGATPTLLDAAQESLAALTTTGATVLDRLDELPRPLLLWRALMQWLGGLAGLAIVVAVLPTLGAAGNFAFDREFTGGGDERLPLRMTVTARTIFPLYLGLTVLLVLGFRLAGLPALPALLLALSVASTGGGAVPGVTLGAAPAAVEWIVIAGLLVGGLNLVVLRALLVRRRRESLRNPELLAWLLLVGAAAAWFAVAVPDVTGPRAALLLASSAASTSGLALPFGASWSSGSLAVLVLLVAVGACSGSTGGGLKPVRLLLAARIVQREVRRLLRPAAVFVIKLRGAPVSEPVLRGVGAFFVLNLIVVVVGASVLLLLGLGLDESFAAVVCALSGLGGETIAPGVATGWAELAPLARVLLMGCMLLGRVEILGLLLLCVPWAWRR